MGRVVMGGWWMAVTCSFFLVYCGPAGDFVLSTGAASVPLINSIVPVVLYYFYTTRSTHRAYVKEGSNEQRTTRCTLWTVGFALRTGSYVTTHLVGGGEKGAFTWCTPKNISTAAVRSATK